MSRIAYAQFANDSAIWISSRTKSFCKSGSEMEGCHTWSCFFFFQAEDGIRDYKVTGVQTCALPICGLQLVDPGPQLLQLGADPLQHPVHLGHLVTPHHLLEPHLTQVIGGHPGLRQDRKSVV